MSSFYSQSVEILLSAQVPRLDTNAILDRVIDIFGLEKEGELARFLKISSGRLGNWRSRNSIDMDILVTRCKGASLHYLLTGEGPKVAPSDERVVREGGNSEFKYLAQLPPSMLLRRLADIIDRQDKETTKEESISRNPLLLNARTLDHDRAELDNIEVVPEASEGRERAKSERKRTGLDPFKKIDDSADKKGRAKRTEKRGTQTGS